ncbi:MAG: DUF4430 domain-containing protein [Clostridia bacterium]|nr:DUF4430 domain-containing protein [Clostridia bacterium]
MKIKRYLSVALCVLLMLTLLACTDKGEEASVWEDATYTEDQSFGKGNKKFELEVEAEGKSVVFTIKTNAEFLGEALAEHKLVDGDDGPYGLYIKKVNGILADYDKNGAYWGFYQDGEYMTTGADETLIQSGAKYKVVYEKQ